MGHMSAIRNCGYCSPQDFLRMLYNNKSEGSRMKLRHGSAIYGFYYKTTGRTCRLYYRKEVHGEYVNEFDKYVCELSC